MPVLGVVFDMDGTLVSQELDFEGIRREIGVPMGTPLLEALAALAPEQRRRAEIILDQHERQAAEQATLYPGVLEFLDLLTDRGIRRAVLTRNSRWAAETVLRRCFVQNPSPQPPPRSGEGENSPLSASGRGMGGGVHPFDPVLAREDGPPK